MLGRIAVVHDGRENVLSSPREAALLADLILHANRVVETTRLADELWRGTPPPGAAQTLRSHMRNLRNVLEPNRAPHATSELLVARGHGYLLRVDADTVDASRFERLVHEGRCRLAAGDVSAAADGLRRALAMWHGPAYGELAEESYLQADATRLEELRLLALEERIEADLALGRHGELCAELDALITEHPYRERLWTQRLLALYRAGRQRDALHAFQDLRTLLGEELGIDPGPDLRALEAAILRQEPGLAWAPKGSVSTVTARRSPHNLPLALTGFVGRTTELAEIAEALLRSRLVTLTGTGGVGKTRLAVETAARLVERFGDGVWLFELAPVGDATSLMATLTAAFGIVPDDPDRLDAVGRQLQEHLSARQVLLVFDNCEHLIEPVARLAHDLLSSCPQVRILATSRELLRLPGEAAVAVPPLALPPVDSTDPQELDASDAVRLFADRAQDALAQFRMTAGNRTPVVRVCHRLAGIPLALELAAARLRMLTVDQIADRLDDCFAVLGSGDRTAPPRQQTLRGALDWSYDLLTPFEQVALRRMSVFPDRFSLEAATAVLADDASNGRDPEAFDVVARLVDKSLVVVDARGLQIRYRLLEPIRQYAAAKLSAAGERENIRRRHCELFLTCYQVRSTDVYNGPQVMAELANYGAALDYAWTEGDVDAALGLVGFHQQARLTNRDVEAHQWLERVLAAPGPADHPGRAQALAVLALLVQESGQPDPERAGRLMHEGMAVAQRVGGDRLMAWMQFSAAELELAWGRHHEARTLLVAALDGYERAASPMSTGWCRWHLGWVSLAEHDTASARGHFECAAELARGEAEGEWLAAHALAALAPLTVLLGDKQEGLRLAAEAVVAARRFGVTNALTMALTRAGEAAILAGSYRQAADVIAELLGLLRREMTRRWVPDALEMAALVLDHQGRLDAARRVFVVSDAARVAANQKTGGTRALSGVVRQTHERLFGGDSNHEDAHLLSLTDAMRLASTLAC